MKATRKSKIIIVGAGIGGGLLYVAVALASGVLPWADVRRLWNSLKRPALVPALEPAAVVAMSDAADAMPG